MNWRMKPGICLGNFAPEEVFTEYIYSLMKERKDFMVFPEGKQILIEEEVDEWNKVHGLTNETPRIMYHCLHGSDGYGYRVKYTDFLATILISFEVLEMEYADFMEKVIRDLFEEDEVC